MDPVLEIDRRGLLALGAVLFSGQAFGAARPCRPPRVLFVCPAGTVKSAIARETLIRRAAERGIAVDVQSRGIHPEDHVSPALQSHLRADGLAPQSSPATAFSTGDLVGADVVVAFDEAARAPGLGQARVWDVPSWNDRYPEAKAALAVQIDKLLDELKAAACRA